MDRAGGELDDKVPEANSPVPSKTEFDESGAVDGKSMVNVDGISDSGSSAGVVEGAAAKTDSLGSVGSSAGVRPDNCSGTDSG